MFVQCENYWIEKVPLPAKLDYVNGLVQYLVSSIFFFLPNYYQNGQNVVVSAYSTDPSWGRTDQQGGNCQIRFFFCKRREFRREIHTPPWLLIGRIIFLTREKRSFAPLIGYNSFAYENL